MVGWLSWAAPMRTIKLTAHNKPTHNLHKHRVADPDPDFEKLSDQDLVKTFRFKIPFKSNLSNNKVLISQLY